MRCAHTFVLVLAAGAALLFAAGCPRHYGGSEDAPQAGTATHPWELQGWESTPQGAVYASQHNTRPAGDANFEAKPVELPPDIGPELSPVDTVDEVKLPGVWLQVCVVSGERLSAPPPGETDGMELFANGQAIYHAVAGSQSVDTQTSWSKTAPGRVSLPRGGAQPVECYVELYRDEFLYAWDQQTQSGAWWIRIPPMDAGPMKVNRFDTTFGVLHIKSVVGQSFSGTVTGTESTMSVSGFYLGSIISMRWEDLKNGAAGYACFHVDQHWDSLFGAMWRDDYQAPPFTGSWDGKRIVDASTDNSSTDASAAEAPRAEPIPAP